ncbi:MAG: 6-phosphofructokinase [Coriobacteriia bacterium]|nr:6-phosphofructokinase [Coriobacteriia bacterium]
MSSERSIKRVGMLFSGGPAPAANAVISATTLSFRNDGVQVVGFLDGYENLEKYSPERPLVEGEDYVCLSVDDVSGIRNRKSIILRTSRANPGKHISTLDDLADPAKNAKLMAVYRAFESLGIDGLVSIGGDDTLKTANYILRMQDVVPGLRPISVIHLPKTIDNDYYGIDWTFGFTSAADFAAKEIKNLSADARSTKSWYILEVMGRKAGWLTYAAGIAGEATRMISVEDCIDGVFDLDTWADELVELMLNRAADRREYGIICVAEGLAEHLPPGQCPQMGTDEHGNPVLGSVKICESLATAMEQVYQDRTGERIRVRSKQIGYETRCTEPVAFDVMLGSQLGVGAHRAMVTEGLTGHMVSVKNQMELTYVPFGDLVDPATLKTRIRFIECDSDFYKLARALEYQQNGQKRSGCND